MQVLIIWFIIKDNQVSINVTANVNVNPEVHGLFTLTNVLHCVFTLP